MTSEPKGGQRVNLDQTWCRPLHSALFGRGPNDRDVVPEHYLGFFDWEKDLRESQEDVVWFVWSFFF